MLSRVGEVVRDGMSTDVPPTMYAPGLQAHPLLGRRLVAAAIGASRIWQRVLARCEQRRVNEGHRWVVETGAVHKLDGAAMIFVAFLLGELLQLLPTTTVATAACSLGGASGVVPLHRYTEVA